VILSSAEQPEKTLDPILETEFGIVILLSDLQFANAPLTSAFKRSGMIATPSLISNLSMVGL
jgi:hypothetical protein